VLKEFPKSRDSDQWLTLKIWAKYYPSKIKEEEYTDDQGVERIRKYVLLNDILNLPREDAVKRYRAIFQNNLGMYPPTCIEVVRKRKQNEFAWYRLVKEST